MGRTVVTDLTPEQRRRLAAELRTERARILALRQPSARAMARFGSFADTASEALRELRTAVHDGGGVMGEAAEMAIVLFLSATKNAERSWEMESVAPPVEAVRRLLTYREEYRAIIAANRFLALPAMPGRRALPHPSA